MFIGPEHLRRNSSGHSSLSELQTDRSVQFWHLSESTSSSRLTTSYRFSFIFVFLTHVWQLLLAFTVLNSLQTWNTQHFWLHPSVKVLASQTQMVVILMFCHGFRYVFWNHFIFRNPWLQTPLVFSPHRSGVDKEDTEGTLHALRLADDLELNDGRNLRAALRPFRASRSDAGSTFVRRLTALIFFHFMYFVHVFITLYWYL